MYETNVTPKEKPTPSATKFIERSALSDLDDLIQQRRLELSALRMQNRKRQQDNFPLQTPMTNRVRPNPNSAATSSNRNSSSFKPSFRTPKLDFSLSEEALEEEQRFNTPFVRRSNETKEHFALNENEIIVDKAKYAELLTISNNFEQIKTLQEESSKKYEVTVSELEGQLQCLANKCSVLSTENANLDVGRFQLEQSYLVVENERNQLRRKVEALEDEFNHFNSKKNDGANALSTSFQSDVQPNDPDFQQLYKHLQLENTTLLEKIQVLQSNCDAWEASSNLAAKSAFEWEAHCNTLTTQFETVASEWQASNASLVEENENLKQLMENQQFAIEDNNSRKAQREETSFVPDVVGRKSVQEVNDGDVDERINAVVSKLRLEHESELRSQHELAVVKHQKLMGLLQVVCHQQHKAKNQYSLQRAFHVMKLNFFMKATEAAYATKCKEVLVERTKDLEKQYRSKLQQQRQDLSCNVNDGEITNDIAATIRQQYKQAVVGKEHLKVDNQRITHLIIIACAQAALWVTILVFGHLYLKNFEQVNHIFHHFFNEPHYTTTTTNIQDL